MYDLGFPTDAIEVVKNLYQNATTQVRLPQGGHTPNSCRERDNTRRYSVPLPVP